jgi:hypothetical protein
MKRITGLWLNLFIFAAAASAQSAPSGYSQSYVLFMKGAPAGIERVTERTSDSGDLVSESDHEINMTDGLETKSMAFSTKLVLAKGAWTPKFYSYRYKTGDNPDGYEVTVQNGRIRRVLTRGGSTNEVEVAAPLNLVIVDFNVYHHYDYLIRRYDFKLGGRQVFADFVPLIGTDIAVALTFLGDADLTHSRGTVPTRNFKIDFVGVWGGSLFVDKEGRLVRLQIPAQDLEVVRADLAPQQKE